MQAKHSFETIELYTPEELDLWCDELNGEDLPVALLDCLRNHAFARQVRRKRWRSGLRLKMKSSSAP